MKKHFFVRGLIGLGIGNLIGGFVAFIFAITTVEQISITMMDYAKYTFACSVIGFIFASGNILFEVKQISLVKATIIHFFLLILTFIPLALFAGWIPYRLESTLYGIVLFIISYITYWLVSYYSKKSH